MLRALRLPFGLPFGREHFVVAARVVLALRAPVSVRHQWASPQHSSSKLVLCIRLAPLVGREHFVVLCVLCILCEIKKTTQTTSTTHIMLRTFWEDNTDNENNNFILTICLVLSTSINCLYCSYCLLNQKNLCILCDNKGEESP